MNPYSLPALICMVTMPFLGAFIFSQNPKSQTHRLFLFLSGLMGYWGFIEFGLRQSESFTAALFWSRAGSFTPLLSSFMVHFILASIGRWKDYDKIKAYGLVYAPAIIIGFIDVFTGATNGAPIKESWGWTLGRPTHPVTMYLYFSWKGLLLAFTIKESIRFIKTASPTRRKPFLIIFAGILVALIIALSSVFVFKFARPDFPDITLVIGFVFSVFMSVVIWKYNLLQTPADMAEDIIDLMGDSFILADANDRILRVNQSLLKLTGYREEDVINEPVSLLIDDPSDFFISQDKEKRVIGKEARLVSKSHQLIPMLFSRTIVCNKADIPTSSVIIGKDLSYWHKSQQELLRAEKLESLELITGGIAHDYNNLLTTILAHLSMAEYSGKNNASVISNVVAAEKASHLAAYLTKQLSSYSKELPLKKEPCDLSEIIKESCELSFRGSPVKYECKFQADLMRIESDRYQIMQVFINLFINARQAMEKGGMVLISGENCFETSPEVKITIKDNGCGISKENLPRIFETFFTTKPKGTGLGLSIVKNIIKNHNGGISVVSRENAGSTFTILLPGIKSAIPQPVIKSPSPLLLKKRILIMDDDDLVRNAMSTILTEFGHDVIHAKSNSEAIEAIVRVKAGGNPFDLVILDLALTQKRDAQEAIKRILEIDPGVRAILSSGNHEHPIVRDFKEHGFVGVIKKPFLFEELIGVLNIAFQGKTAG